MEIINTSKELVYKLDNNRYVSMYFLKNDIWITKSDLAMLCGITTQKLKPLIKELLETKTQFVSFSQWELSKEEQEHFSLSKKYAILYNANLILAVLYRQPKFNVARWFHWYSRQMKELTGIAPLNPDPEITGRGRIYVYFGKMEKVIYNTEVYFRNAFVNEWFNDPTVRKMIKDIDKGEVLDSGVIRSNVLGMITPYDLSGGVKTLILLLKAPYNCYNVSTCGNNCAKWILKFAKEKNLTINLNHIMDFGEKKFDMVILNNSERVHNMNELVQYAGFYL